MLTHIRNHGHEIQQTDDQIIILGNYLEQYDQSTHRLDDSSLPLRIQAGEIIDVTSENVILKKKKGLRILIQHSEQNRKNHTEYIW